MSSKFTDGEWRVVGEIVISGQIEVIAGGPKTPAWEWEFIASVHYEDDDETRGEKGITKEQALANARLIATAKKLYEACKAALPYLRNHVALILNDGPGDQIALDLCAEAIKKVEGNATQPEVISNL